MHACDHNYVLVSLISVNIIATFVCVHNWECSRTPYSVSLHAISSQATIKNGKNMYAACIIVCVCFVSCQLCDASHGCTLHGIAHVSVICSKRFPTHAHLASARIHPLACKPVACAWGYHWFKFKLIWRAEEQVKRIENWIWRRRNKLLTQHEVIVTATSSCRWNCSYNNTGIHTDKCIELKLLLAAECRMYIFQMHVCWKWIFVLYACQKRWIE